MIAAFSDADKNNDGFLSMDEYIKVFHEHGVNITAEEVALYFATKVRLICNKWTEIVCCPKLFNSILELERINYLQDKDRDGLISYEEFCDKKTKTEIAFEVKNFFSRVVF